MIVLPTSTSSIFSATSEVHAKDFSSSSASSTGHSYYTPLVSLMKDHKKSVDEKLMSTPFLSDKNRLMFTPGSLNIQVKDSRISPTRGQNPVTSNLATEDKVSSFMKMSTIADKNKPLIIVKSTSSGQNTSKDIQEKHQSYLRHGQGKDDETPNISPLISNDADKDRYHLELQSSLHSGTIKKELSKSLVTSSPDQDKAIVTSAGTRRMEIAAGLKPTATSLLTTYSDEVKSSLKTDTSQYDKTSSRIPLITTASSATSKGQTENFLLPIYHDPSDYGNTISITSAPEKDQVFKASTAIITKPVLSKDNHEFLSVSFATPRDQASNFEYSVSSVYTSNKDRVPIPFVLANDLPTFSVYTSIPKDMNSSRPIEVIGQLTTSTLKASLSTYTLYKDIKSNIEIGTLNFSSFTSKLVSESFTYPDKAPFPNSTLKVIPVWVPSMLGNAYGGGFIITPTIFLPIPAIPTVSTHPAKYSSKDHIIFSELDHSRSSPFPRKPLGVVTEDSRLTKPETAAVGTYTDNKVGVLRKPHSIPSVSSLPLSGYSSRATGPYNLRNTTDNILAIQYSATSALAYQGLALKGTIGFSIVFIGLSILCSLI